MPPLPVSAFFRSARGEDQEMPLHTPKPRAKHGGKRNDPSLGTGWPRPRSFARTASGNAAWPRRPDGLPA